jgi:hypothetical protein
MATVSGGRRSVPAAGAALLGLRTTLLLVEAALPGRAAGLGRPASPRRRRGRLGEERGHPVAGGPAVGELTTIEGGDHFVVIDPSSDAWRQTLTILDGL